MRSRAARRALLADDDFGMGTWVGRNSTVLPMRVALVLVT